MEYAHYQVPKFSLQESFTPQTFYLTDFWFKGEGQEGPKTAVVVSNESTAAGTWYCRVPGTYNRTQETIERSTTCTVVQRILQ